jgi:hypothetical protein
MNLRQTSRATSTTHDSSRESHAMKTRWISGALGLSVVMMLASCTVTTRVSVSSSNQQGNSTSIGPAAIGAGGRYVLFNSEASNLVPDDTNNAFDAFVRDTATNTTTRVDLSTTGQQLGDFGGGASGISDDGRYVVFSSWASNAAPSMHGNFEAFLRDLTAGTTTIVSHTAGGAPASGGGSGALAISPDGRFVLFSSTATDLAGQVAPPRTTLYRYDRDTGSISKIATPAQCSDTGANVSIPQASEAWSTGAIAYVAFCDEGSVEEAAVYVKLAHEAQSVLDTGFSEIVDSTLDWATDGSLLAYTIHEESSRSMSESAVLKLWTGSGTPTTSTTPGGAFGVSVSGNGRYLAYTTDQAQLSDGTGYTGTRRIVVLDRHTNKTAVASANSVGAVPNQDSNDPALSNDGTTVGFDSTATDVVPNDTNNASDVFTRPVANVFAGSTAGIVVHSR